MREINVSGRNRKSAEQKIKIYNGVICERIYVN